MASIIDTPRPPYYTAIFTSRKKRIDEEVFKGNT